MARIRHKNKHLDAVVQKALARGWRLYPGGSHIWGQLFCPLESREGCRASIHSTPRNPESHAKNINALIEDCKHDEDG